MFPGPQRKKIQATAWKTLGDFWQASTECLGAPWQLICRIDGHVSVTKDALDFVVQLHEQLLRICRVASGIVNCLKGMASRSHAADAIIRA